MNRRIVLISFTPLDAGGGVPRWNRDFIAGFPGTVHFCAKDIPGFDYQYNANVPEWIVADTLDGYLIASRKVTKDDVIIADGFWGDKLSRYGYTVISLAHGIWSHLTQLDVLEGKQPEFPAHHAVQVRHRRDHLSRGGKIVAVSDFISDQMKLQWGFESEVINNAVDLERFRPPTAGEWGGWHWDDTPVVVHGVTTANKGFDHIDALKAAAPDAEVELLDDLSKKWEMEKYTALRLSHMCVQPSAYEGNSYFVLETLASGVPIVAYNVGLLWSIQDIARKNGIEPCIGAIIPRPLRSPAETAKVGKFILESVMRDRSVYNPRQVAELFSIQKFHEQWRDYFSRNGLT